MAETIATTRRYLGSVIRYEDGHQVHQPLWECSVCFAVVADAKAHHEAVHRDGSAPPASTEEDE